MTNGSAAAVETQDREDPSQRIRTQFQALYAPVQDEMMAVEEILQRELRSDFPFVDDLVQHAARLSGKRLRPALLLLAGRACGGLKEDHLLLGAVVEMIHTATLIHDDVLDEAALRRHQETVNARWDNEASVLLGDYLFSHSFYLASTLESTFACQCIGRSTNIVCRGELLQIASRGNYDLTEDAYFEIIDGKTAELTACCCLLGACYAGANEEVQQRLQSYGRYLGRAFQIADDLLDVLGTEDQMGKSLGSDLEKEKPTLPLIHLLSQANAEERSQLTELLSLGEADRRVELLPRLRDSGAIEYAQQQARHYATLAMDLASELPSGPAQEVLVSLPDFVVSRQH